MISTTKNWEETRLYYEKFSIEKVMFRSPTAIDKYGEDYINILGNDKASVRAGNWFEIFVITHYETNRPDMPDRWYRNKCNYQSRSPGLAKLSNESPEYISLKISGYEQKEYYPQLYHYRSENSWYNHKRYYRPPLASGKDVMGETSTRRYIPVTGKDGTITLNIISKEFDGIFMTLNTRMKNYKIAEQSRYL